MSESQQYTESGEAGRPGRSPGGAATWNRETARPAGSTAWLRIGASLDDLLRQRPSSMRLLRAFAGVGLSTVALMRRCRRQGIRAKLVNGATLRANEVSKAIYEDFLPAAVAAGQYRAVPEPRVMGHGLQHIQAAIDAQLKGVSSAKIVVSVDAQ